MFGLRKKYTWILFLVFVFSIFSGLDATAADMGGSRGLQPVAEGLGQSIKLQWYLPGDTPEDFDQVIEKLNEHLADKAGATVNFNLFDIQSFDDRKDVLVAAGETIDLIFTNWWSFYSDTNNGLFYPIGNLLGEYAPKTKKELGDTIIKGGEVNGEIYALPVPGQVTPYSSGIIFRKDLVKKYNINLGKIKKLEDVESILKLIKSKRPSIIPLLNNPGDFNYNITGTEMISGGYNLPGVLSSREKDFEVLNVFSKPETMAYLKTLYKFRQAGYLKSDSDYSYYMRTGKVFSVLVTDTSPLSGGFREGYDWTEIYLGKPFLYTNSLRYAMNAVGSNSKYPERALGMLEFIGNDAYSNNLLHFGIEGKHYVKVSGNIIDYPKGASAAKPAYSQNINWVIGNRYLDFTWKNEDPDKYKKLRLFNNSLSFSKTIGFEFDTKPVEKETSASYKIWDKYVPKLLSGEYDPTRYLPTMNSDLKKAGLDKILAEMQYQYDGWLSNKPEKPIVNTSGIRLVLGGETLTLKYPPAFSKGVVMVPLTQIFNSLDVISNYDAKTGVVNAIRKGSTLRLTLGSAGGTLDGKAVQLAAPVEMINKQVYIPLESVSELFGFDYNWDKDKKIAEITDSFTGSKGNSWGNTANYGYAASEGDWKYISLYGAGIFKMRSDGSGKTRLHDKAGSFMNAAGGWLYFSESNNASEGERQRLYKVKADGSSKTRLTDDKASYVNLVGEWLYFINDSNGGKPYRMRIDRNGFQKLSDFSVTSLFADDGWLYFRKKADGKLYKMRTSGTDIKMLSDSADKSNEYIQKTGQWIYYYGTENSKSGIYKMKTDGSGKKLVVGRTSYKYANMDGVNIYYSDYSGSLYKINETERTRVKIGSEVESEMSIDGDWIYYFEYIENYKDDTTDINEYRIKTDGTIKQKIDKTGLFIDIYSVPASIAYSPRPINIPETSSAGVVKTAKEIVKYKNAVVHIKVYGSNGDLKASGSGFNIEGSGTVVTNFHVIEGASSVKCSFDDDSTYEVEYVLNCSSVKDVAILKLKGASGLPVVNLGDSAKVELADSVLAIGNPLELQNTISDGIVSGIRTIFGINLIQTTASISPGSSGGPLFNEYGEVIGITSMTMYGSQNINFAVPINSVKKLFATARYIPLPVVGNYDNEVIEFESNNNTDTANAVEVDNIINGSIDGPGDVDFYRLRVNSESRVDIYGTFDQSDNDEEFVVAFNMKLLDENGALLSEGGVTFEEGVSLRKITIDLKKGTYYLSVSRVGSSKYIEGLSYYSVLCIQN